MEAANRRRPPAPGLKTPGRKSRIANPKLAKVFFSDDGSTAIEVALKLAYEFARRTGAAPDRAGVSLPRLARITATPWARFRLGHIDLFHQAYGGMFFKTGQVMSPYCYRCPFNRAKPERADARDYRQCHWECVGQVERKFAARKKRGGPYAAFVFEPLMQGAAGMIPQPAGWLRQVAEIARGHGALLIADEVMTGLAGPASRRSLIREEAPARRRPACSPRTRRACIRISRRWPRG